MNISNTFTKLLFTLLISLFLNACNNDADKKQNLSNQQVVQKYSKDTLISGRVSNKKGNIRTGTVKATDSHNKLIASTQVDNNGHYTLTIPAKTELPLTLSHTSDANTSKLISIVIYASYNKFDINDLTTLIAKKAKSLGGYTHANMSIAADETVGVPDANKTSTGFRGDPTKQYGGWH